jgi:WD40 repeat protein
MGEFPRGLGDVYKQFFDRQFKNELKYYKDEITPLLYPILSAFEPLTLGFLMQHRSFKNREELFDRLDRLGSLFPASGESDTDTIRPFHRSICDWITVKKGAYPYFIDIPYGHRVLADAGWEQFEQGPETMDAYFLAWLPSHLLVVGDDERLVRLLKDFRYLMEKTRRGMLERLLKDFRELPARLTGSREKLQLERAFFREKAHIMRRGNEKWPVNKILLQLAVEHADDSPLTLGAEQFLADDRCDWLWLRDQERAAHAVPDPCVAVLEGHTGHIEGVLALPKGRILSWASDHTLRLWTSEGSPLATLEGHTNTVNSVLALKDGRLLSSSLDHTLRLWTSDGVPFAKLEGHTDWVIGALVLADGRFLSWSYDNTIRLWASNGASLKEWRIRDALGDLPNDLLAALHVATTPEPLFRHAVVASGQEGVRHLSVLDAFWHANGPVEPFVLFDGAILVNVEGAGAVVPKLYHGNYPVTVAEAAATIASASSHSP